VEAGEYRPVADIAPVALAPCTVPLTDQTIVGLLTPLTTALYCAVAPNLTWVGPLRETVCACRGPLQAARMTISDFTGEGNVAMNRT
jgi:hypothetical protein